MFQISDVDDSVIKEAVGNQKIITFFFQFILEKFEANDIDDKRYFSQLDLEPSCRNHAFFLRRIVFFASTCKATEETIFIFEFF